MSFLAILGLCFAQEIVFVPSITDNPLLSKGLREALSISARGRDRYILTTQNFNLYIEQHNLDLYSIAEKQQALEQAKALKAKHLILATYTQKDQDHILKAQIYRSDLGAIQATIWVPYRPIWDMGPYETILWAHTDSYGYGPI